MLKLTNVNKSYDDKLVLHDVSLSIETGTVLGVVGPNGSGKSTILRLLAGVIEADAGLVQIDNQNIFDNAPLQEGIVFLADDPYFLLQSTLKDMKSFYKKFYSKFDDLYYTELVSEFNISETEKLSNFSKGMKRQATLILAMACKPKILMMDETFDGLDPIMRFKLKQFIIDGISSQDMIVVISSHALGEIESICDSIILVNHKGISISERMDDLFDRYTRFQVVFEEVQPEKLLKRLNALSIEGNQRIYNIIMRGDRDAAKAAIDKLEPLIVESTSMTLDEIYRYEVKGDSNEKIL